MAVQLSESQVSDYKRAFSHFDADGNGSITTTELATVIRSLGQNPTDSEVQQLINKADTDKNGTVELTEFLDLMSRKARGGQELRDAFKVYDKDGNGLISAAELKLVLGNLGQKLSQAEVEKLIRAADINGDGQIDYEEFVKIMLLK